MRGDGGTVRPSILVPSWCGPAIAGPHHEGTRIEGRTVPPSPRIHEPHHLKVQVRRVLGRVPRRANVADHLALRDWLALEQPLGVMIEVRVVEDEPLLRVGGVAVSYT